MDLPGEEAFSDVLEAGDLPPLARVRYEPETPSVADVAGATTAALDGLAERLPEDGTVAIGVGSRGIHDIVPVTRTVVTALQERGLEPVIVPAMGSHGGATPDGQRSVLDGVGISPSTVGCAIDARMDTEVIDRRSVNGYDLPVHFSRAALEADAVLPINRVKPHTDFSGPIESGICKMLAVGWGKQPGARTIHRHAKRDGYVPALRAAIDAIAEAVPVVGGIAILENFHDETGEIAAVTPPDLVAEEATLLDRASSWMPTLPFDAIDLLVVNEMGKDVSGTGMDTNVIGRGGGAAFGAAPSIDQIYVRSLTPGSKGNANGIGLADVTHRELVDAMDPTATYTNALTSGNIDKVAVPIALPSDRLAIDAAVAALGVPPAADLRLAWIQNTGELSSFRASPALLASAEDRPLEATGWERVRFEDGAARFDPTDPPDEPGREH